MKVLDDLTDITCHFSETMIVEFAEDETALGNRLIGEALRFKGYDHKETNTIRALILMDCKKQGW